MGTRTKHESRAVHASESDRQGNEIDGKLMDVPMRTRDQLAYEVYQSILRTQRGDWIDLMHCAPLASQYHMSNYSKLKFGSNGAPYAYLPLSLQQPAVTESVLAKQRQLEVDAWRLQLHTSGASERPDALRAMKMTAEMSDNFQERMEEDLQCAKEDTATATSLASPTPMIKTSDSHPIKCVKMTYKQYQLDCAHLPTPCYLAARVSAPFAQLEHTGRVCLCSLPIVGIANGACAS